MASESGGDYLKNEDRQSTLVSPSFVNQSEHLALSRDYLRSQMSSTAMCAAASQIRLDLNEDKPMFTIKAIISGVVSGTVCTFLALYYGLKTGITPSLNILGGVLGYGVTRVIMRTGFFGHIFTPQENAVIQTISVAVYTVACPSFGFAQGWLAMSKEAYDVVGNMPGNNIEDIVDINWWRSVVWSLSLFSFGFFIAYPARNHYVIKKRLLFPSGTATAYVISALHQSKENAKIGLAILGKFFSLAFIVNMFTWCWNGLAAFPIFGTKAAVYGWTLDFDLGSFGIGMLVSIPVNASILLGAVIIYAGLQPWIDNYRQGDFPGAWFDAATESSPYLGLYSYALFSGLAVMIVQGAWGICEILVTVIIANCFSSSDEDVTAIEAALADDPLAQRKEEIFKEKGFPLWGSALGYICTGAVTVLIHYYMLNTQWYETVVALATIPLLAFSNVEGMGRTDWDVASSYGKLMMFPIGFWNHKKSIIPSLAVCHTTISGCSNSAVLMQDFKTGYLLGASPAVMFYSQVLGTFIGCFICPSLFTLLRSAWVIPVDLQKDPSAFIPGKFGPIFRTLAIIATGSGFDALPRNCVQIAIFFVGVALVLNILTLICDRYAPKVSPFIPGPSAMSVGMLIGGSVPMEFFAGGVIVWIWTRHRFVEAETQKNYVASGLVAGSGFSVVAQCLVSFTGFKNPLVVAFVDNPDYSSSIANYISGSLLLVVCLLVCLLGIWTWFRVPVGVGLSSDEDLEESIPFHGRVDRLDDEDVLYSPQRIDSASSNGFLRDSHLRAV